MTLIDVRDYWFSWRILVLQTQIRQEIAQGVQQRPVSSLTATPSRSGAAAG